MNKIRLLFFVITILFLSYGISNAQVTVTNLNDSGPGSLRDAITIQANPGDTIQFAESLAGGTITLLSEIAINNSLTITGPAAGITTISGGGSTRIFNITGNNTMTIVITGLRLANGFINGAGGGAIRLQGPNIELNDCVFDSNTAICNGFDCDASGAGLDNRGGVINLVINRCTFVSNSSTCSGNECDASGAGLDNGGGSLTIEVNNSTFASNFSSCSGIDCRESGSSIDTSNGLVIYSSIFSTDSPEGNCRDIEDIVSLGYNIDNGSTCITGAVTGDKPNTPPGLDPVGARDNGGPTPTIALLIGSPAIDMGDPNCPPPATDQRGVLRPQGPRCDIGAFEGVLQAAQIPTLSEWGLVAMAGLLGIIGFMVIIRRKVTA